MPLEHRSLAAHLPVAGLSMFAVLRHLFPVLAEFGPTSTKLNSFCQALPILVELGATSSK